MEALDELQGWTIFKVANIMSRIEDLHCLLVSYPDVSLMCADWRKRLGLLVDLALLWELPGPVLYPPSVGLQSNIPLFMAHGSPSLLIEIMRFMMRKNETLQKVTQALVPYSGTRWNLANEIWEKINYQCGLQICPPCLNYEPHAVGQGHILTVGW